MKSGDMQVSAERPAQSGELIWCVALFLLGTAMVAFWYFNPAVQVAAQIHEIAMRGRF